MPQSSLASAVKVCLVFSSITFAPSALGQAVTFSDLQGLTVNFSAVHRERFIKFGQERTGDMHTSGQVKIGAGDTLTSTITNRFNSERGSRAGPSFSGTFTLGKPIKTRRQDDILWIFEAGNLIRLRVHGSGSGGQKLTINFARRGDGFQCSFSMPFARENGTGAIEKGSEIDSVPIEILSWTPVSSNCEVHKGS
jgi:hypothetical protein